MKFLRLIVIPLLWLGACANPVPPSGGEKDETPPSLMAALSTPNLRTNFTDREFVLTFDEWIKLDNVHKELIISPPLQFKPEIIHRGKTVKVNLHEEERLLDNTTYTFQFGESIKDLNEGNAADALKFVFSTGDIIDSLTLSGTITDVLTNEAVEDMKVMLYSDLRDSIPLLERPVYVARTNTSGVFSFSNLRSDTFRLIAISDENFNYKYDPGKEGVAFLDSVVFLNKNTSSLSMIRFEEPDRLSLIEKVFNRDRIKLTFSRTVDTSLLIVPEAVVQLTEWYADSTIIWLKRTIDSMVVQINQSTHLDTIILRKDRKASRDTSSMLLSKKYKAFAPNLPTDSLLILFNKPIIEVNSDLITIMADSASLKIDTLRFDHRRLQTNVNWRPGASHRMVFLPGAVTGINGKANSDTLTALFKVPESESLGTINFTRDSIILTYPRLVHLYGKDQLIRKMVFERGMASPSIIVRGLRPGKYEIEIIHDLNANGKWDTGDYMEKRQPEPRYRKILEPLRENWDLKIELEL